MNIRNAVAGIALGWVIVALMKSDDAKTLDSPKVRAAIATVTKAAEQTPSATAIHYAAIADPTNSIELPPTPAAKNPQTFPEQQNLPSRQMFPTRPRRLTTLLRESIAAASVSSATESEIDQFEQLFLITLQHGIAAHRLKPEWSKLGWELEGWESAGERFLAVREANERRQGRGLYVIRVGSMSAIAIQAPHRFYDTRTGLLTRKLFDENDVVAAAWNTVHRDQVDLAHCSDHFVNAMTRAMIKWNTRIVVAQLHGFANEKQTGSAMNASIIMSDATEYPGRLVQQATATLKDQFGPQHVLLYPNEVSQLGGTLNRQARVFHSRGRSGFLHVELNQPMREKLTADASVRAQFFSALTSAAANRQDSRSR